MDTSTRRARRLVQSDRREIRMANPFSAIPTAYQVFANDRWRNANFAWDASGVCAALASDGTIQTPRPDCGDPITETVRERQPDDETILFHCRIPASRWRDDIVFT